MNKTLVSVYKSPRKAEMYLYTYKQDKLDKIPAILTQNFGPPQHVMDLLLTPQHQLARVDAVKVLESLEEKGFYLQMPPPGDDDIQHLPDEFLSFNDPV